MKIVEESHLFGRTILEHEFPAEFDEVHSFLTETPVPLRPPGPFTRGRGKPPKRQRRRIGGKDGFVLLPADLPALNTHMDTHLRSHGWKAQPYASQDILATTGDRSRGDFVKNDVFVEVEFGNTASLFRDLFKFQVANRERQGQVAILITAVRSLARLHDSGVTTFEKVKQLLPYMAVSIQMPIWVIGLEADDVDSLRERYVQMHAVATEAGVDCHDLVAALGYQGLAVPEEEPVEGPIDESL